MTSHRTGRPVPASGVIPPLVTPFTENGEFDSKSLQRQAETLIQAGVGALWVNGTTAEFHDLSEDERTRAIADVVEVTSGTDCAVIGQVGSTSTRRALALTEAAVAAGADAVCAVVPYYLPYEQDEMKQYLRDIKAAAGIPLYVYQVPVMTKVGLSTPSIIELVADGVVDGMKDSFGDATWLRNLLEQVKADGLSLPTFVGDATLADTAILAGASGAITAVADVIPKHVGKVVASAIAGDFQTARTLQTRTVQFLDSLKLPTRPPSTPRVAALKFLLAELGAIATHTSARPFRPLTDEEQQHLRSTALPLIHELESA